MAIYVVSVHHGGGFLPRYYADVDAMLLPSGNPFKCHEEVLYSHLNVLTCSSLAGGCSEGLDAFRFFYKHTAHHANTNVSICTVSDVAISKPYPDILQYLLVSPIAVCNTLSHSTIPRWDESLCAT